MVGTVLRVYTHRTRCIGELCSVAPLCVILEQRRPGPSFGIRSQSREDNSVHFLPCEGAVDLSLRALSTIEGLRNYREHRLRPQLLVKRAELRQADDVKTRCDALGLRYADRCIAIAVALILIRNVVLFYWVYFLFDWNLVEPITYLLERGAVCLGFLWYGATSSDARFESFRQFLVSRRTQRLYAQHNFNAGHWKELVVEVEGLEEQLRGLETV
ncbi:Protein of unknown function, DUF607, putative [Trypanosoma equiperdum]|uniref:Calcium uniporter protein C-terminal domain-containing protein n=2 Tax=Trypanozoon TaxID=39700 RepID=Q38C29_TRYB2|nr:hypothetical protein, conserved [Trypanosoma brucei brucei TREU927]EAN77641.1 hypothetical protein, conserved [Trypanosoma brucei brucei TREU927]SCU67603.1 Protein of unknown function, DUF607, putative [Trypanosoma equiperdum]